MMKNKIKEILLDIEDVLCQDRTVCGCCCNVWEMIDDIKRENDIHA